MMPIHKGIQWCYSCQKDVDIEEYNEEEIKNARCPWCGARTEAIENVLFV